MQQGVKRSTLQLHLERSCQFLTKAHPEEKATLCLQEATLIIHSTTHYLL